MRFCNALHGLPVAGSIELAAACETAGFEYLAISDHVFYPERLESKYPYTPDGRPQFEPETDWLDPWVAISAMAAATSTLRFMTNVYILPLRNPFVTAKAVSTAAFLSGGRVELGIGAGWMKEEFDQLDQPFRQRGKRMDEIIDVLRVLWSGGMVEYHGEFYDFDRLEMRPAPPEPIPIHVGGHSDVALRRAAQRGDGWIGVYYPLEEVIEYCERLRKLREDCGRADEPFDIIVSPLAIPTPDVCRELEVHGVTTILTSAAGMCPPDDPLDVASHVESIAEFGRTYIDPARA